MVTTLHSFFMLHVGFSYIFCSLNHTSRKKTNREGEILIELRKQAKLCEQITRLQLFMLCIFPALYSLFSISMNLIIQIMLCSIMRHIKETEKKMICIINIRDTRLE